MGNLTCPAGIKLISGDVANQPELSKVPPFCIDEHEVTNAEYDHYETAKSGSEFELFELIASRGFATRIVVAQSSDASALRRQGGHLMMKDSTVTSVEIKDVTPSNRSKPEPPFDGPNHPAIYVNWYGAWAYCQAQGGDLPMGDQWEKAARGPQGYEYGTRSGQLNHEEAQYDVDATAAVASYPSNGYGVYDMTGNVREWTLEYEEVYFDGLLRGLRGGSWGDNIPPTVSPSSFDEDPYDGNYVAPPFDPTYMAASYPYKDSAGDQSEEIGFRCVRAPQRSRK